MGFDCNAGYSNWMAGWSDPKKACCCTGADNHGDEDGPGPRACRYGGGARRIIHYHHDHVCPFRLQCRVLQLGCWMVGTQKGMVLCSWRPWVQVMVAAWKVAAVTTDGVHFSSQVFPRCCP